MLSVCLDLFLPGHSGHSIPLSLTSTSLQVAFTNSGHALPLHLDMHLCILAAACESGVVTERLQSELD